MAACATYGESGQCGSSGLSIGTLIGIIIPVVVVVIAVFVWCKPSKLRLARSNPVATRDGNVLASPAVVTRVQQAIVVDPEARHEGVNLDIPVATEV